MNQREVLLDQIDIEILNLMQQNARISNADIARDLNMAPSAVLERVKKLEHKNVILQYTARLNPSALQQNLLAFIFIKADNGIGCNATAASLASIPEVQEVHHAAGDDSYLIKIRTRDSASLMDFMRNTIGKIPNIQTTRTSIILETVKEQQQLVIPSK